MNYDFDIHPDFIFVITEVDNVITILEEIDPEPPFPVNFGFDELDDESDDESSDTSGIILEQIGTAIKKLEEVQQRLLTLSDKSLDEESK
jgi:hypothetical protein